MQFDMLRLQYAGASKLATAHVVKGTRVVDTSREHGTSLKTSHTADIGRWRTTPLHAAGSLLQGAK